VAEAEEAVAAEVAVAEVVVLPAANMGQPSVGLLRRAGAAGRQALEPRQQDLLGQAGHLWQDSC
jgi:hypothetical protein